MTAIQRHGMEFKIQNLQNGTAPNLSAIIMIIGQGNILTMASTVSDFLTY
jgi:hypothetical protein